MPLTRHSTLSDQDLKALCEQYRGDDVLQEIIRDYRCIRRMIERHFGPTDMFLNDLINSLEGLRHEIETLSARSDAPLTRPPMTYKRTD